MKGHVISLVVLGIVLCIGLTLVGIVIVARQFEPDEYKGPSPEVLASGPIHQNEPRDSARNWYDPEKDPDIAGTLRKAVARPERVYGRSQPPQEPLAGEVAELFRILAAAGKAEDNNQLKARIDIQSYIEERVRLWDGARPGVAVPESVLVSWNLGYHNTINHRYLSEDSQHLWDRAKVVRLALAEDGRSAVATVRHERDKGPTTILQWRLAKGEWGWRVYDFTDARHWMWHSAALADIENGRTKVEVGEGVELGVLSLAVILAGKTDASVLDEQLTKPRGKQLPPVLAAWRAHAEGCLQVMRGDPAAGLPFFNEAVKDDPLWPLPLAARSDANNRLRKHVEALADARSATELVGPWSPAIGQEVTALRALGRSQEADEVLRAGRVEFPDDPMLKKLVE